MMYLLLFLGLKVGSYFLCAKLAFNAGKREGQNDILLGNRNKDHK